MISVFERVWERLLEDYGPQGWWPAESRFEIIVGAVLVQRTAWRNAALAIENLRRAEALSPEAVAKLDAARLQVLIRPAGFYRVKAERLRVLADFIIAAGGLAQLDRLDTQALRKRFIAQHGIGAETADAILGYAFARPVFVVDAYARRLFGRFLGEKVSDQMLKRRCESELQSVDRLNELHALIVVHSQRRCGTDPECAACGLIDACALAQRRAAAQPARAMG